MVVGATHTFKTAIGSYPHTLPLKDGRVTSPRLCLEHVVAAAKEVAGGGPPDGLELNRDALALLARYAFEQHITSRTIPIEELYAPQH